MGYENRVNGVVGRKWADRKGREYEKLAVVLLLSALRSTHTAEEFLSRRPVKNSEHPQSDRTTGREET